MKIGGVTGWLRAVSPAEGCRSRATSFRASARTSWPSLDPRPDGVARPGGPILKKALRIEEGHIVIPAAPGNGIEWDEESVQRYLVD
jgi:mandelate racemase